MSRKDASAFERQLYRVQVTRADVERLTRVMTAVPVRKPIMGEIELSQIGGTPHHPRLETEYRLTGG